MEDVLFEGDIVDVLEELMNLLCKWHCRLLMRLSADLFLLFFVKIIVKIMAVVLPLNSLDA